jgi:hypothetical protein
MQHILESLTLMVPNIEQHETMATPLTGGS